MISSYPTFLKNAIVRWYFSFAVYVLVFSVAEFHIGISEGFWSLVRFFIHFAIVYCCAIRARGTKVVTYILIASPICFLSRVFLEVNSVTEVMEFFIGFLVLSSTLGFYLWNLYNLRQINNKIQSAADV